MFHKNKINSRFIINGFTINPVINKHFLINIMTGLSQYQKKHMCDYSKGTIHTNYLGKMISAPEVTAITDGENKGVIAYCVIENGYYVLRLWTDTYPAKIQFDLFLEDDLKDTDLIVDHLCAPAVPNDGLGLFDYSYSTEKIKIKDSVLLKDNKKDSSYKVNDPIKFLDDSKEHWEVTLNQLKTIECYYCKEDADSWIFIDDMSKVHADFKIVPSCNSHIDNGRIRELSSTLGNKDGVDFYSSKTDISFVPIEIKDEDGSILYTKNFPVEVEVNND